MASGKETAGAQYGLVAVMTCCFRSFWPTLSHHSKTLSASSLPHCSFACLADKRLTCRDLDPSPIHQRLCQSLLLTVNVLSFLCSTAHCALVLLCHIIYDNAVVSKMVRTYHDSNSNKHYACQLRVSQTHAKHHLEFENTFS